MTIRRMLLVAALLLATTFAQAQQLPRGRWWRREEVVRQLALTRDQQEKLDEVFRGAADNLIDARATVDKLQVALRVASGASNAEAAAALFLSKKTIEYHLANVYRKLGLRSRAQLARALAHGPVLTC